MVSKTGSLIASRLKTLRQAAGLSQQDLATKAGLSVSVVSQIEQDKKPDPFVSTVQAPVAALQVDYAALLGKAVPKAAKRWSNRCSSS